MTTHINLTIPLESLLEAVSALNLDAKRQILDLLEQQIFAAEEANYQEDPETVAEMAAIQAEYDAGEFIKIDNFDSRHLPTF